MRPFPDSADAFYDLRDDRTNRCPGTDGYQNQHVAVACHPRVLDTARGLLMLQVSAALLARWCRRTSIVASAAAPVESVVTRMEDADPFGSFKRVDSVPDDADLVLDLGGSAGIRGAVRAQGWGWLAAVGPGAPLTADTTPEPCLLGAAAAACLGVAEVFRRAVGLEPLLDTRCIDMFGLAVTGLPQRVAAPPSRDLGPVLLVGAGAVGSAVAYITAACGFTGRFTVIDLDEVKVENFNRSPLFGRATYGRRKASVVAEALRASGSWADAFDRSWDEFVTTHSLTDYRGGVWVPVADEQNVRWSIQHNYPPLAVHASTSPNWTVSFGRHLPGLDDCLLCRFPVAASDESSLGCSTANVHVQGVPATSAALPFVALLAGVLVVAELARLTVRPSASSQPNWAQLDLYPPGFALQTAAREPLASCECGSQVAVSRRINGGTRFALASPNDRHW